MTLSPRIGGVFSFFSALVVLSACALGQNTTWNGSVNREQMRDCGNLMGKLVPQVIEIMMDNPGTLWGDACYPVVT